MCLKLMNEQCHNEYSHIKNNFWWLSKLEPVLIWSGLYYQTSRKLELKGVTIKKEDKF